MGVVGQLFAKSNDFKATGQNINQDDLNKFGYNTIGGLGSSVQGGLGESAQAGQGQQSLATQLLLRAQGKAGPSIAEQQLGQSLGQVQQQGAGSMAAARGVSPGTAARLIGSQQTQAAQTAAGQGAILRSQEQQAAENQLANVLQGERQGALGQSQVAGGINQGQNQTAAGLAQGNQQAAMDAQRINSGVAQANTNAANSTGMGMLNAAGGAMGLAHGGEVPETGHSLAAALLHSHKHLSSAHEALAKYASGGEVQHLSGGDEVHGSYDFPGMDLTAKPGKKAQYVPHDTGVDATGTGGATSAGPGHEGTDSEGKEKKLHLADGGEIAPMNVREDAPYEPAAEEDHDDDESSFERQVRERREARDRGRDQQTANDMRSLGEGVEHKAAGGLIGRGIHALGQALGIGENDSVVAANTEGGKRYSMSNAESDKAANPDTDMPVYRPTYGQGSTFGANAGDESDTSGANVAPYLPTPPPGVAAPGEPQDPRLATVPGMGMAQGGELYATGGSVPGHAKVAGNSPKNDTVPTMLSPGEVVIPRDISHDPDAAREFVQHINARNKAPAGKGGYGAVLSKQRELHQRLSALESRLGGK